jgi:integration host factor subunit alpha
LQRLALTVQVGRIPQSPINLSPVVFMQHQEGAENVGALTKAEMAEKLINELGLNKRDAKDMVELFFSEIRECLTDNEQVKISGFGNFDLRDKRERPGRNPKTGEEIPISARRVVTFKAGQKLKARVECFKGE